MPAAITARRRTRSIGQDPSARHARSRLVPDRYDDGGLSGASLDRPALQNLLADVRGGKINTVVVYKVDRLTRSLADFAKPCAFF
jgi:site-specific DNA recombinase